MPPGLRRRRKGGIVRIMRIMKPVSKNRKSLLPFLLLIKIYQRALSPLLHALAGPGAGCRFLPTCSCYAADALRAHGLLRGSALAAWRLLRCNPLNAGGLDPVPPPAPFRAPPARPRCKRVA